MGTFVLGTIQFINNASPQLNAVAEGLDNLGMAARRLGGSFMLLGAAMYKGITDPLKAVIKMGIDFEHQFANVAKTVKGWDLDIFGKWSSGAREFRQELRNMAKELPFTHKELAEIAAFGGQFGIAADQLGNFTSVVAKLGTAVDGIEAETAAKGLAQIAHITNTLKKDPEKGFERLASTLVDLGNKGISTEGTILEITRRMTGAGQAAGFAAHEMFGWSAAVANLGHRSELGGNALSNTILKIARSISEGGEKLEAFAKISGMTSKQFKENWSKDASATLKTMVDHLAALPKAMQAAKIGELFGVNVRQNQVMLTLIATQSLLTSTLWDAKHAYESNTALQQEFTTKANTLQNQLQVVQNRIYDIAITIAQPFMDAIRSFISSADPWIKKLEDIAKWFENLDKDSQELIVKWTLLGATVIPGLIVALGGLLWTLGTLATIMSSFMLATTTMAAAASGSSPTIIALSSAFTALRLALAGVGTGIVAALPPVAAAVGVGALIYKLSELTTYVEKSWINPTMAQYAMDLGVIERTVSTATTTAEKQAEAQEQVNEIFAKAGQIYLEAGRDLGIITPKIESAAIAAKSWYDWLFKASGAWTDLKRNARDFFDSFSAKELSQMFTPGADIRSTTSTIDNAIMRARLQYEQLPDPSTIGPLGTPLGGARLQTGYLGNIHRFTTADPANNQRRPDGSIIPGIMSESDLNRLFDTETASLMQSHMERVQRDLYAQGEASESAKEAAKRLKEELKKLAEAYEIIENRHKMIGLDEFKKFNEMTVALQYFNEQGLKPGAEFFEEYGDTAVGAARYIVANGGMITAEMQRIMDAGGKALTEQTKLDEERKKKQEEMVEAAKKNLKEYEANILAAKFDLWIGRQVDPAMAKIGEISKAWLKAKIDMREVPAGISSGEWQVWKDIVDKVNFEKLMRAVRETKALAGLKNIFKGTGFGIFAREIDNFFKKFGGAEQEGKVKKAVDGFEQWQKSVKELVQGFSKLKTIMGDTFNGSFLSKVAEWVSLMSVGSEIGESFREGFAQASDAAKRFGDKTLELVEGSLTELQEKGKGAGAALAAGIVNMVVSAVQAYALLQAATDKATKSQRVMSGMFAGAGIGAAMGGKSFGVYGAAIGAIVGAVWGAFRKVPWAEIGKRVGFDFGVEISDALAKTIEKDANKIFGGDWQAAAIYNIKGIIDAAGGINNVNFDQLLRNLHDAFALMEQGRMTADQVRKVLDETFDQFLAEGTDSLGFVSQKLLEIVDLALKFGIESKSITAFFKAQGDSLIEAINVLGGMMPKQEAWKTLGETVDTARKAIEELNQTPLGDRDSEWASKMAEETGKLNKALAEQQVEAAAAATQMEHLGITIAGTFFASIAAGRTFNQAMRDAKEGLDSFFGTMKNLGLSPNDPLLKLLEIQWKVQQAIPNTIAGVDALGQSIVGLYNMKLLTPDIFSSIQATAYDAYVAIQGQVAAVGGSTRDALIPMQAYLQQAARAAKELNIPLDATTQMMIDQSIALGIWKELGPTPMEAMTSALNTLIGKLDILITQLTTMPEAPNPFRNWTVPPVPDPENPNAPPPPGGPRKDPPEGGTTPPFASGTLGTTGGWFKNFGSETLARLHGSEAVITPGQAVPFAASVLGGQDMFAGSSSSGPTAVTLLVKNHRILTEIVTEDQDSFLASRGVRR